MLLGSKSVTSSLVYFSVFCVPLNHAWHLEHISHASSAPGEAPNSYNPRRDLLQGREAQGPDIRQGGLYVLELQKKKFSYQRDRPCYCVMTLNSGLEVTQGH